MTGLKLMERYLQYIYTQDTIRTEVIRNDKLQVNGIIKNRILP